MNHSVRPGWPETARKASDLDRQIVDCLMEDGRMSGRDIAQRLGVSEATVSRRLAALEEEKLLVVRGFIQPVSVGFASMSFARFSVEGDAPGAAATLARQKGFHRVARIDGGQQLTALLLSADSKSNLRHIDRALATISALRLERMCEVLQVIPPGRTAHGFISSQQVRGFRQADIQTKILQTVRFNMRKSLNQVSEQIHASPSATRANLDRLIEHRIITTVVCANPHFMGTPILTQLRVRPRAALDDSLTVLRELLPQAWIFQCLEGESLIAECPFASPSAAEQKSLDIQRALAGSEVSIHLLLEIHSDLLDWWCDRTGDALPD